MTYFALAPIEKYGFNAGAVGSAVVLVSLQFFSVNVLLYLNSRFLKLNFLYYFAHQFVILFILLIPAFLLKLFIDRFLLVNSNIIFRFFISGVIYSGLVIVLAFTFPYIFGLYKDDLKNGIKALRTQINIR